MKMDSLGLSGRFVWFLCFELDWTICTGTGKKHQAGAFDIIANAAEAKRLNAFCCAWKDEINGCSVL